MFGSDQQENAMSVQSLFFQIWGHFLGPVDRYWDDEVSNNKNYTRFMSNINSQLYWH